MHTPVPPNPAVEPLTTLQDVTSPSRPRFSIPSRLRNYFIMIKAAKLRSVSSVSARSGFSVRSARGDRNEDDARVARRQHRTIREQSVQSSALKARLQQKAVARPSARVVNSKFTRLLSVPGIHTVHSIHTHTHVRVPRAFPSKASLAVACKRSGILGEPRLTPGWSDDGQCRRASARPFLRRQVQ